MFPFTDYVGDGETIYLAVHAKYADRLTDIGSAAIAAVKDLTKVRLLLMVFSDQLEMLYLCNRKTIESLRYVVAVHRDWREGNALDPVIGIVLYDHPTTQVRKSAKLFVYSDGDVTCYWNLSTLNQLIETIWLNESGDVTVTPFGNRREVVLIDPVDANPGDDPQQDRQDEG